MSDIVDELARVLVYHHPNHQYLADRLAKAVVESGLVVSKGVWEEELNQALGYLARAEKAEAALERVERAIEKYEFDDRGVPSVYVKFLHTAIEGSKEE